MPKTTAPTEKTFRLPLTASRPELLPDGSDHRLRRLLYHATALAQRIEQFRAAFAGRLGITTPQFNVLLHVAEHQGPDGMTVAEVARGLLVSGAHVTAEVNVLVSKGLIEKSPNPHDKRSVLLKLTAKGEIEVSALTSVLRRVNDRLFRSLTAKEFSNVSAIMGKMLGDAERTLAEMPYLLENDRSDS